MTGTAYFVTLRLTLPAWLPPSLPLDPPGPAAEMSRGVGITANPLEPEPMYPRKDERTGLYGYWTRGGWAIEPRYRYAHPFSYGFAAVDLEEGVPGLIGLDGTPLDLRAICGGRIPFKDEDHSWGGFTHDEPRPTRRAVVWTRKGDRVECGLIDTDFHYRPLPDAIFAGARSVQLCGSHAIVKHRHGSGHEIRCGLFDLGAMRLTLPIKHAWIEPSDESIWTVKAGSPAGGYAFYDVDRGEFLPGRFTYALPFSCGFGGVFEGEWDEGSRAYFVDRDLRRAFDAEFDDIGGFSHGLAAFHAGDDVGYLDTSGRPRLILPYQALGEFNAHGFAIANRDEDEWDLDIIDRQGQPRLRNLSTADFCPGDFPHFEVRKDGRDQWYDLDFSRIYEC